MKPWVVQAIISMLFAGVTTVIAKQGLIGISAEMGIALRACFVFFFMLGFVLLTMPFKEFSTVQTSNLFWLGISSFTTTASWIYYYRALKAGDIATVALIDKGSVVIAIVLAWIFFKEVITLRIALGSSLILSGLLIISKKS